MRETVANFVRALAVLLLLAPPLLGLVNTPKALAAPAQSVAAAPAVEVPVTAPEATEDPWTARFLGPAVVIIAVVAIGASVSYYVIRVRGRYRVG
jgi:hypothetical protein